MYFRYDDYYRVAVKAYTSNLPILVNGSDINVQPYPALNYQPNPTIPPYSYVPIAQFSKVGAEVKWDENTKTIYVTTDYFQIKTELENTRKQLNYTFTREDWEFVNEIEKSSIDKLEFFGYFEVYDKFRPFVELKPNLPEEFGTKLVNLNIGDMGKYLIFSHYRTGEHLKYFYKLDLDSNWTQIK